MFCPNCGTQQPDGSAACGACGYQFRRGQQAQEQPVSEQPAYQPQPQPAYEQPAYQSQPQPTYEQPAYQPQPAYQAQPVYQAQPSYQPQPAYQPAPVQPSYVPKTPEVTEFDKKAGKLIPITFIITLILLAVSIILPLTTDLFEIPFMSFAMSAAGAEDDMDDARDELEDTIKEAEYQLEIYEDDMDSDQKDAAEKVLDAADKVSENFSLLNFRSFVATCGEAAKELEDYDGVDLDMEEFEEIQSVVDLVVIAAIGMFALPLIFTLLGGLLKSKGLTITALVFIILPQLLMCGVLWVALSLVVYIFQAVLCGKAKKAKLYAPVV